MSTPVSVNFIPVYKSLEMFIWYYLKLLYGVKKHPEKRVLLVAVVSLVLYGIL